LIDITGQDGLTEFFLYFPFEVQSVQVVVFRRYWIYIGDWGAFNYLPLPRQRKRISTFIAALLPYCFCSAWLSFVSESYFIFILFYLISCYLFCFVCVLNSITLGSDGGHRNRRLPGHRLNGN